MNNTYSKFGIIHDDQININQNIEKNMQSTKANKLCIVNKLTRIRLSKSIY